MTAKKTIEYMAEKDYLKHWLSPELDLYKQYPGLGHYEGKGPRTSPKFCSLDSNLIHDLHLFVNNHIRLTKVYDNKDPKHFSLAAPVATNNAYY